MIEDLREMSTELSMNMRIAKLLFGYTDFVISSTSGLLYSRISADKSYQPIPEYSTDFDAAWELLPLNRHVRIVRYTDRGGAAVGMQNEIGAEIWNCDTTPSVMEAVGFAETPALAVCLAWLAWKERE